LVLERDPSKWCLDLHHSKNANSKTSTTLGNTEASSSKTRDIKCFKCQGWGHIASQCVNKRVMVINAQGELESENEEEVDDDDMPSSEDADNEQNAVVGDLLVARRVLNVQVKEEESNQRGELVSYSVLCGEIIWWRN
jgi:hypothetical protein